MKLAKMKSDVAIALTYASGLRGAEKAKVVKGCVHAYGIMPNTNTVGWYEVGRVYEVVALANAEAEFNK